MTRNYYVILGVATNATPEEIKAAFRRRARESHPDTSGLESGLFLEVPEAYGVLSDPERRREHDVQVVSRVRRRPWRPTAEPLVSPRPAPEPFSVVTSASGFHDFSLDPEFAEYQPSFDEMCYRLWSNLS